MTDPSSLWTIVLPVTAFSFSLVVNAHFLSSYTTAYFAAPHEIAVFTDTVDFSIQENESYDSDVSKVQRLEDKIRLNRLLREIQKTSDELRDDLNRLMTTEGGSTLRTSARMLWANHRKQLEEKLRRMDMLRIRFLVVYVGIVSATASKNAEKLAASPEKAAIYEAPKLGLPKGLTDSIKQRPPLRKVSQTKGHHDKAEASQRRQSLQTIPQHEKMETPPRRLSTQTLGHYEKAETPHKMGWKHVIQELQRSPMMHRRHASIEQSMRSPPPMSPLGSPVSLTPQMDNTRFQEAIESIPERKLTD
ncbi:hypothetical protein F4804DRAFT_338017 [Jackrogersella minutella]|nr:hypothetical protein F4804DRAFT_338017 [Jackrogersella minutella]